MKILVANPNATDAITAACGVLARAAASSDTEVIAWTNREGPPMVDSFYADHAPVPVVEPIACAVRMAEAAVRLGLRQSKTCKFAPPPGAREGWA